MRPAIANPFALPALARLGRAGIDPLLAHAPPPAGPRLDPGHHGPPGIPGHPEEEPPAEILKNVPPSAGHPWVRSGWLTIGSPLVHRVLLGRPVLYGTTKKFLQVFGLKSLDDLPLVEQLVPPHASGE
jgi:hypothetical protein